MEITQMVRKCVGVAACGVGMMAITMNGRPAIAQDAPTAVRNAASAEADASRSAGTARAPVTRAAEDSAALGKNAAFTASDEFSLAIDPSGGGACNGTADPVMLTVTIEKGKKKSVLAIEGMLNVFFGNSASTLKIAPYVNGLPAALDGSLAHQDCGFWSQPTVAGQRNSCIANGTWFVDLDAAEAALPGEFVKKPLVVELIGCVELPTGVTPSLGFNASLTARMEKK